MSAVMKLYFVRIVDRKRPGARKRWARDFAVMAERGDLAEARLRLDDPSAFVFAERVEVRECEHAYVSRGSLMVAE